MTVAVSTVGCPYPDQRSSQVRGPRARAAREDQEILPYREMGGVGTPAGRGMTRQEPVGVIPSPSP